jgi:sulfonate transport system permease protein
MAGGRAVAAFPLVAGGGPAVRRRAPEAVRRLATGLVVPAALLAGWQVTAANGWLPEQILPAPAVVLQTARDGLDDGSLLAATVTSLGRVARGFAAGGAAGLLLGAAMGLSPTARRLVHPLFLALSQVPVLGWVPILVLLVGLDEALKLIVIAWAACLPVVLGTMQGIRDVPPAYLELGRALSFGRWSQLRTVVLPAAVPSIFTGLREGLANSWQTLVVVELLASYEGLGYLMTYGRQLFQLELVLVAMAVVGAIGLVLHLLLAALEARLQRWRPAAGS